jgi:hypothetical protein
VKENPRRDDEIEALVSELERLHVTQARVDPPRSRELDHAGRDVHGCDTRVELSSNSLRQLTRAGADLENIARPCLADRIPEHVERARPLAGLIDRPPSEETRLRRVVPLDDCGIIELHSSMTRPGSLRP